MKMNKITFVSLLAVLTLFVFSNMNYAQVGLVSPPSVSSGYGFIYNNAVTTTNDTLASNWFWIGDHSTIELGFAVNDSAKLSVIVNYQAGADEYGTITPASTDTLTTTSNTGAYMTLVLRGYNSAGTFVNRIPASNKIRVTVVRLTGSAVTFRLQGRAVFKN